MNFDWLKNTMKQQMLLLEALGTYGDPHEKHRQSLKNQQEFAESVANGDFRQQEIDTAFKGMEESCDKINRELALKYFKPKLEELIQQLEYESYECRDGNYFD